MWGSGVIGTHAVEAPGVLELVSTPYCGDGGSFPLAEVVCELLGDGFCGQEGSV